MPEIVEALEGSDYAHLAAKSVGDHLQVYRQLFAYARRLGAYAGENPFQGVRMLADRRRQARGARAVFTHGDLKRIFSHPIWTQFDPADNAARRAHEQHHAHSYWAPLIGLLSGARRAEIAGLCVDDIRHVTQIDRTTGEPVDARVFDFNQRSEDKRLKTPNSERLVPVHPKLIQLGLLDFVDACRRRGQRRLFEGELDNWTYDEGYGRPIGEHFNRLVRQVLGEHVKGRQVFHSLRHTQATALRDRGVPIELIEAIAGRASSDNRRPTTGERVYIKPEQLRRLQEAVERLDFGDALDAVNPFPAI